MYWIVSGRKDVYEFKSRFHYRYSKILRYYYKPLRWRIQSVTSNSQLFVMYTIFKFIVDDYCRRPLSLGKTVFSKKKTLTAQHLYRSWMCQFSHRFQTTRSYRKTIIVGRCLVTWCHYRYIVTWPRASLLQPLVVL